MLTSKMHMIADEIGRFIFRYYEQEYLETMFLFGLSVEDIILQVLVVCCRNAYLINAKKHPLSYYIRQEGCEVELARKERERTIKYIKEKNKLYKEHIELRIGDRFPEPDFHFAKDNNRFSGYEFSEFQYWENKNIHDMELVKSIVERRISSSKRVPVDRFKKIAEEYDSAIETMKDQFGKDPENTVFSSIQLFTLQCKYAFDFIYELAALMEEIGIKEFPDMYNRLMIAVGNNRVESSLPDRCPEVAHDIDRKIVYPLIIQRRRFLKQIVGGAGNLIIDMTLATLLEANVLVNAVLSHMFITESIESKPRPLPVYITEETTIEDWASVFEIYDVFQTFVPQKEWTDARIKSVRKMFDLISIDYKSLKHPENRP